MDADCRKYHIFVCEILTDFNIDLGIKQGTDIINVRAIIRLTANDIAIMDVGNNMYIQSVTKYPNVEKRN